MSTSKVFTEFTEGLRAINSSPDGNGPGKALGERFKNATSSVYDMAAAGSAKGDIWNWGMHDDAVLAEIREVIPGFARYDTDGFSEQLYFLALREVPLGLDEYAGKSVLEVGCGLGEGLNFLSRLVPGAELTGLDLSTAAIDRAKARLSRSGGLTFVHGDAENLPFEDDSLDVVVNIESSHTYPDFERFLAEVARVLKPGGWLTHIDTFTTGRYELLTRLKKESGPLEWVHERDISAEVRTAIRRRMTPGSHFRRAFDAKRMPLPARVLGEEARKAIFGAKFAGFPESRRTRLLKKAGLVPALTALPDSYRHHVARKVQGLAP
ncbi:MULTISPECIES: class I SAM-dependent methyltransferase [Streptomycetaceae]|uniref:Methyltransferase type 11 n=1 Tax=Streptantibioticus cattleyicolor (strain ATCC 35852 / DSM 46488 / JCM 4925 / NBRC 14057 / NRRL 8057) TaxID=1003195 RepID=F8JYE7_STREN|nr:MULTISPECIES: class I SAM-dependent methyltransferase [Streptomycetaceae]AEW95947.1 methyltransferase type 11 [Streptantibioticus cattleyicolor NRRL 8057 = DSM 46488]MYS60482.1 methyltransferase domain-containing protein [Streptomyces sp. SID5468]CCB76281.1 Methyltransferase type 11 [Streptantibioticus cattleyicolor NRRL 8057 = DSM 46488]